MTDVREIGLSVLSDAKETRSRVIQVEKGLISRNQELAEQNRQWFKVSNTLVFNVLSSPGSGKTTFLARTLSDLNNGLKAGVIVGDLATDNDAERIRASGAKTAQITTGGVCHLEADMIAKAAANLDLAGLELLVIENVGNLVCPASYDLGEDFRVVILAVTEGEDKPLKYPKMFKTADVVIINKIDIAEVVGFDREAALKNIRNVTPGAKIFEVSAHTGKGMEGWYGYLKRRLV